MNTHKLLGKIGTGIAIGVIAIGSFAFAGQNDGGMGHGGRGHGPRGGQMEGKMADKLGLTADQKTKIQAIRDQFKKDNATALDEIQKLHEQMRTYAQNKDKANMQTLRQQIKTKEEALKPARDRMRQQIDAILTPEQRATMEQMKQQRQERMGERKQQRQQGAQGNGQVR